MEILRIPDVLGGDVFVYEYYIQRGYVVNLIHHTFSVIFILHSNDTKKGDARHPSCNSEFFVVGSNFFDFRIWDYYSLIYS